MVITVTAAIFVYYYLVDRAFTLNMYAEYLDDGQIDLLSYKEIPDEIIEEYGLTIQVVNQELQVTYAKGIHADERREYSMKELVKICNTDTWLRYVIYDSFNDESGNENIVIFI